MNGRHPGCVARRSLSLWWWPSLPLCVNCKIVNCPKIVKLAGFLWPLLGQWLSLRIWSLVSHLSMVTWLWDVDNAGDICTFRGVTCFVQASCLSAGKSSSMNECCVEQGQTWSMQLSSPWMLPAFSKRKAGVFVKLWSVWIWARGKIFILVSNAVQRFQANRCRCNSFNRAN